MTTFTIELDDRIIETLQNEAQQNKASLPEWIARKLQAPVSGQKDGTLDNEQFSALARGVVNDYRVVLERLA